MSARITLHCDRLWRYGGCPTQLLTDARTVAEAHATGERLGWTVRPDQTTYCPPCSGAPRPRPAATVVQLHPPTPIKEPTMHDSFPCGCRRDQGCTCPYPITTEETDGA